MSQSGYFQKIRTQKREHADTYRFWPEYCLLYSNRIRHRNLFGKINSAQHVLFFTPMGSHPHTRFAFRFLHTRKIRPVSCALIIDIL